MNLNWIINVFLELLILGAALYLYRRGVISGRFELKKARISVRTCVLISLGGAALSLCISLSLTLISASEHIESFRRANEMIFDGSLIMQLIRIVIIAPAAEELVFRGLIQNCALRLLKNRAAAVIIAAALFGLYHGNLVQGLAGFVCGLVIGIIYEKCGTIAAPVLFHMCFNLTGLILSLFAS